MAFEQVAKSLLKQSGIIELPNIKNRVNDKIKLAEALSRAGFSVEDTCNELRALYDDCGDDEKAIKRQILDTIAKMNGMLTPDDPGVKVAPVFNLQISGDNIRVNNMLCPVVPE